MTIAIDTEINVKEQIKSIAKEPERYKVVFMNDSVTPMDFVVSILTAIFRHTEKTAQELTMKIHNDGSAVVGVYMNVYIEPSLCMAKVNKSSQDIMYTLRDRH